MNGGFAEYVKSKIAHAYKLPDSLTDEQGAFVEMLSSAVYSVQRAEIEPENFAVVYGPGPVGLSMVQLLKNEGARVALVGTRDYRLETRQGARRRLRLERLRRVLAATTSRTSPKAIKDANDGALADRVLVATASVKANQQAIEISGPGSTVVLMGLAGPEDAISVPLLSNLYQDKTIRFSLLYPLQWPKTIRILADKKIDTSKIITHSASLDGIAAGDRARAEPRGRRRQDRHQAVADDENQRRQYDGRAEILRLRGHDVPSDLRAGPRRLP